MKTFVTVAALALSSTAMAQFHPNTHDWNNDVNVSAAPTSTFNQAKSIYPGKAQHIAYTPRDNGIFGYNPYSMMDPRWMMEEMSNVID